MDALNGFGVEAWIGTAVSRSVVPNSRMALDELQNTVRALPLRWRETRDESLDPFGND